MKFITAMYCGTLLLALLAGAATVAAGDDGAAGRVDPRAAMSDLIALAAFGP